MRTRRWMALMFSLRVRLRCLHPWGLALGSIVGETRPRRALFPAQSRSQTSAASLGSGREFFVGLSKWTNHRGAEIVADTFRVRSGTSFVLGKWGADGVGGAQGGGAE